MKTEKVYSVGILDNWLRIRTTVPYVKQHDIKPTSVIPYVDYLDMQVHEDDLKAISPANPYSLIRMILMQFWNESRKYSEVANHAAQAIRKEQTGEYDTAQQKELLEHYNVIKDILNTCPELCINTRNPNRRRDTKRRNLTHPKLMRIGSLCYVTTMLGALLADDTATWLPHTVRITSEGVELVYGFDENADLFPEASVIFEAPLQHWIMAWNNWLKDSSEITLGSKDMFHATKANDCTFDKEFIGRYYYDYDVHYPALPIPTTQSDIDYEEASVKVEQAIQLSDDDIFPKPDGETIIVPESNMTDKMFAPKNRLKFPIHCRAFYLSWSLILRAERSMLEDYCRVVERVIKARYPDLKIEFHVESTNQVVIIIRDYDLEEDYPLVDYTIDLDAELEKPINRLTDNRLFRRIRVLEGIIDECHELFYEFCRTEYLARKQSL